MRVLVTGHRGVIGSIICPRLKKMGFRIKGYDLLDGNDILDYKNLLIHMERVDAVVHLAGIPRPTDQPWEDFNQINVEGTECVKNAFLKSDAIRLVYMSSCAVYGITGDGISPKQFPISVNDALPVENLEKYAKSKLISEGHVNECGVSIRIDTPTPHARQTPSHLFATVSEFNLAEGVRSALISKSKGSYNIVDPKIVKPMVYGEEVDLYEWLQATYPNIPNTTKNYEALFDISKSRTELGYKPK